MLTVTSSAKLCVEARPWFDEKRGAGGSGRRGLPPYVEAGVPGRGLPLISAGSNRELTGGGRVKSGDAREGDHDLGNVPSTDDSPYETYESVGGGKFGGSRIEDRSSSDGS